MKKLVYLYLLFSALESAAQNTIYPYAEEHLWGLTNANKEVVATPQFDTISYFYQENPFTIAVKNKKYGTVGRDGKTLVGFAYDKIYRNDDNFGVGLLNGKKFLLNLEKNKPVFTGFEDIESYCECEEKQFIVVKGNKKIIISGITGKQLGNGYDHIEFFNYHWGPKALIFTGGKYGVIDTRTGILVIPAKYEILGPKELNKQFVFKATVNRQTSYFDLNGKPIKAGKPDNKDLSDDDIKIGVMNVDDDEDDLYITSLGNNNWKLSIESRGSGRNKVFQTLEVKGYSSLEKIFYQKYNEKLPAVIKAVKEGKTGIIGLKGEVLTPFEYDDIESVFGYYQTMQNGKAGLLNDEFKLIKKPVLKRIISEENGLNAILIEMPGGQRGYMNKETGKIYIPGIED